MLSPSTADRPREKLQRTGSASLGDNELLAILIGSGFRRQSALDVANALLEAAGGLHGLTRLTVDEVRRVKGMGRAKAAQVLAAVELGRRTLVRTRELLKHFTNPRDVAAYLLPQHGSGSVEQFGILMLDTKHRPIRTAILSVGSMDASVVHPREVFRVAAAAGAAAVILFHNHPSGDPTPSMEDVALTHRLYQAGQVMGIDVIDHIILADNRYCSFQEARTLRPDDVVLR